MLLFMQQDWQRFNLNNLTLGKLLHWTAVSKGIMEMMVEVCLSMDGLESLK